MRADQNRAKDGCQMGWIGCLSYMAGSSKSYHNISISTIFLQFPEQLDMKNVVKYWKYFLSYSNTLETYRVLHTIVFRNLCYWLFLNSILQYSLLKQIMLMFSTKGYKILYNIYWVGFICNNGKLQRIACFLQKEDFALKSLSFFLLSPKNIYLFLFLFVVCFLAFTLPSVTVSFFHFASFYEGGG